jgi:hypothetical protein
MFFLRVITSVLHISLACASYHKHRHRALAQPSIVTSTETYGVAVTIPTNPGSSVPIEIGIDGYASRTTLLKQNTHVNSPIGIIEIGSPGQTIDVQFDTTFDGVLVRSARENITDLDGILVYNNSESKSWGYIYNDILENTYTQTFRDGAYAIAFVGREIFNIGGKLYSDISFGQLEQYHSNMSGQAVPFGGASGIIGLNYNSMQQLLFPDFMYAIRNQLIGTSYIKAAVSIH